MNNDLFKGKWNQFKGKVKEKWGKLTDDELTRINGKRDQLLGRLQERYGWEQERAEEELANFERSLERDYERKSKLHEGDFPRKGEQKRYEDEDYKKKKWG